MTTRERETAANAAATILSQASLFNKSNRIACYLSYKDEFNTNYVIEAIWHAKKHCYVPVLSKETPNYLNFAFYQYGDALHPNKYSILEPVKIHQLLPPENLDLVLLPLTAFDSQGHRLGAGGGYYDKTLSFTRDSPGKPLLIGLGYAIQEAPLLPFDPWDIHLDGMITEKGFLDFR